jgi:hypothetical protein
MDRVKGIEPTTYFPRLHNLATLCQLPVGMSNVRQLPDVTLQNLKAGQITPTFRHP